MREKLWAGLFCGILCGQLVYGQGTSGTIAGTVKDASAAVISGVAVTIKNVDTGMTRTVSTDDQGRYHAPNLLPGNYELDAQTTGFRGEKRTGITLSVGQQAAIDFTLTVGTVAEQVTVTGEAPLVETTNATLTGLVDDKTIRDLPLNGRSFDELVLLQVGTILSRRFTDSGFLGGGQKISISGARPQANSFWLDGADVNDSRNTMPGSAAGVLLGVDTVREFRVLTNSYSAEYGRSAGGAIVAVTRSGTNELHGSAFEFLRNSALDARNFFDPGAPPPFKRNQFGFTTGGPIQKDKTFFFGSYEGYRQRLGQTYLANVPSLLTRQGCLPTAGAQETGCPAGFRNVGVAPGVQAWLGVYPLPNGRDFGDGTAEYSHSASLNVDENYMVVRGDHSFSSNHSLFGRYTLDSADKNTPQNLPMQSQVYHNRSQYAVVEWSSILSPTTLNSLRAAYNRTYLQSATVYDGFPSGLGLVPGVPFSNGGLLEVSSLESVGNQRDPQWNAYNLFQWSDDVTLSRGSHSLKTGLIAERLRFNLNAANSDGGNYRFTGGLLSFLQGRPGQFIAMMPGASRYRAMRQSLFGFYFQDEYRVRPRLTLNLGLREEFMTSPSEVNGRLANLINVMADWPKIGNPLFDTFKRNLSPRFGFAWDSLGNGKMVLRGGFGAFYDQPFPTYWKSPSYSGGPPFTALAQLDNPPFPNGFAAIDPKRPTYGDIRPFIYTGTPYSMQYNFTIQSQITADTAITFGYAGSQGRKFVETGNVNIKNPTILPDGRQFFPANALRRNPIWGDVRAERTDANSNYNAMVLKVDRRFRAGLQLGGSYTFAKIMSDAETVFGADGISGEHQVMDPFNVRLDRAPASFSETHSLSINYSYSLPFSVQRPVGKLVNGWQVSGITKVSSGAPFPARSQCCSGNGSQGSVIIERPNLLPGMSNHPVLGGPDRYFDTGSFANAETGFYGNLGRNTLVGPGLVDFNFSLVKNTALTEKLNLQFRAEFFNLFNRANFSTPQNLVFDSRGRLQGSAGRIRSTDTSSRQIQFALKLVF